MGPTRMLPIRVVARPRAVPISALPPITPRTVNPYVRQRANPAALFYASTPLVNVRYGSYYGYGDFGFSLGKIVKNVGKAVKKAVVDTGHVVGKAVTSKVGQAIIGTGLAVTGVGLPAAAAIGAATQAGGQLIKPGGNLGKAAKGAVVGGAEGAAAGVAGKLLGKVGVVQTLREKLGTAKPKTYESDSRLDALASGQIPDVGVTPSSSSSTMPVLKRLPSGDVTDAAIDYAKRKAAERLRVAGQQATTYEQQAGEAVAQANKATDKSVADRWRAKAKELLEQAKKVKAAADAAAAVATTTTPPSSNPIAPTGGYPVPSSDDSGGPVVVNTPAQAGFSVPPVALIAGAAALYLLSQRRR